MMCAICLSLNNLQKVLCDLAGVEIRVSFGLGSSLESGQKCANSAYAISKSRSAFANCADWRIACKQYLSSHGCLVAGFLQIFKVLYCGFIQMSTGISLVWYYITFSSVVSERTRRRSKSFWLARVVYPSCELCFRWPTTQHLRTRLIYLSLRQTLSPFFSCEKTPFQMNSAETTNTQSDITTAVQCSTAVQ